MPKPDGDRSRPSLAPFWWCLLAVLAFFLGLTSLSNVALRDVPLWLYADRYMAAELEVTRFDHNPQRPSRGYTIDGILHPGGERGLTSTRDIAVSQFVDPGERAVRRVPLRSEIEGRHLAVWYWPNHMSEFQWWHPPTVIMPGATRTLGEVVRKGLVGVAFLCAAVFCFRRLWRHVKASIPPEPERPRQSAWFGIAFVLTYLGVIGLMAYLMSR